MEYIFHVEYVALFNDGTNILEIYLLYRFLIHSDETQKLLQHLRNHIGIGTESQTVNEFANCHGKQLFMGGGVPLL